MSFPKEHLESLWSPWRVEYFQRDRSNEEDFFAEAARATDDASSLVVARNKNAFLMLNKYPYASGHMMSVPYRRTAFMEDLSPEEVLDVWNLALHAQRLLREACKAEGFNVGFNLGTAGGAGYQDHIHLHIVPRWTGDNNFMPMLAGTRLIPEGLQPLYDRLIAAQDTMSNDSALPDF